MNKTSESSDCFLYSSADSDYSILYYESQYANKVRFVIDENFNLKIRFPILSNKAHYQMHTHDYYFRIIVGSEELFSSNLTKNNNENYLPIKFLEEYDIFYENIRHARLLEYEVLNKISLISDRPVLFKKISGEFVNIPYNKTNLSEEFFLISKSELTFVNDIIVKDYKCVNGIHIYYLYAREINERIKTWFSVNTNYVIVPNRKWIDIFYPNSFMYDEKILINDRKLKIKVTPYNKKDMLTYLSPDNKQIQVPFNRNGTAEIYLDKGYIYNFSLNHEIANELTVQRVDELNNEGFLYPTYLNDKLLDLNTPTNLKRKIFSVESEKSVHVYRDDKAPLIVKQIESNDIEAVHIPYIATYKSKSKEKADKQINISAIIRLTKWTTSTTEEFQRVLNYVKQSNVDNKNRYINNLLSNYNKLPLNLLYELRRGR